MQLKEESIKAVPTVVYLHLLCQNSSKNVETLLFAPSCIPGLLRPPADCLRLSADCLGLSEIVNCVLCALLALRIERKNPESAACNLLCGRCAPTATVRQNVARCVAVHVCLCVCVCVHLASN